MTGQPHDRDSGCATRALRPLNQPGVARPRRPDFGERERPRRRASLLRAQCRDHTRAARNNTALLPAGGAGTAFSPVETDDLAHPDERNAFLCVLSAFPLRTLRPASGRRVPQHWIVAMSVAPQAVSTRLQQRPDKSGRTCPPYPVAFSRVPSPESRVPSPESHLWHPGPTWCSLRPPSVGA